MMTVETRPKHQQVSDDLRGRITSGDLPPGAVVPSERELASQWGFTRPTIRQALRTLENEGRITRGMRRYVRQEEKLLLRAGRHESATWAADMAGHDTEIRVTVGLDPPWLVRGVVRLVDGRPYEAAEWRFPLGDVAGTALAGNRDIPRGSVAYMEEELGWAVGQRGTIETRMPLPEETAGLNIPPGVPVMVERRTGRRGDKVAFTSVRILPGHLITVELALEAE